MRCLPHSLFYIHASLASICYAELDSTLICRRSGLTRRVSIAGTIEKYGLKKRVVPVKNCRKIGKSHLKLNDAKPKLTVDPESYRVRTRHFCPRSLLLSPVLADPPLRFPRLQVEADGVHCTVPPATKLPLTRGYMLF